MICCDGTIHGDFNFHGNSILAQRDKVWGSLCYTLGVGVGVRTWFKFLDQVLYLSYHLSYLHQTCMDDAYGPAYGPERL